MQGRLFSGRQRVADSEDFREWGWDMMRTRLTGKVLLVEQKKFGSGEREFRFREASVQTGIASIEQVRFTDSWEHDVPRAGDFLDVEIEIGAFAGRSGVTVSATAVKPFDEAFALELAAA